MTRNFNQAMSTCDGI